MSGLHDSPDRIVFADGRSVVLAPVQPQDSAAERACVGALSTTSRYRRFRVGLCELSPEMSRAMTEIDQRQHVGFFARPGRDWLGGRGPDRRRCALRAALR